MIPTFEANEKKRQSTFRASSPTISDAARNPGDETGQRHPYLLALGCEEENLFPDLRGSGGAIEYFRENRIQWWRARVSGDSKGVNVPTRNMASSQISCVNFLLPLVNHPKAVGALLRSIDNDVTRAVPVTQDGSFVDFEWIGGSTSLEGKRTRGANATSIDALVAAELAGGGTRIYLLEWKYIESCGDSAKNLGSRGAKRTRSYSSLFSESRLFSAAFEDSMVEPFYQLMRFVLLGHKAISPSTRRLDATEFRLVVVCPTENLAYRRLTNRHRKRFIGASSVELGMREHILRQPELFRIEPQGKLLEAAHAADPVGLKRWSAYHRERYGWR